MDTPVSGQRKKVYVYAVGVGADAVKKEGVDWVQAFKATPKFENQKAGQYGTFGEYSEITYSDVEGNIDIIPTSKLALQAVLANIVCADTGSTGTLTGVDPASVAGKPVTFIEHVNNAQGSHSHSNVVYGAKISDGGGTDGNVKGFPTVGFSFMAPRMYQGASGLTAKPAREVADATDETNGFIVIDVSTDVPKALNIAGYSAAQYACVTINGEFFQEVETSISSGDVKVTYSALKAGDVVQIYYYV